MENKLIFIYDGACPFCNHFAGLLEVKSQIPNIEIIDGRSQPPEMPEDYDMDEQGALLICADKFLSGPDAINFLCTKINNPSARLLSVLTLVFKSKNRTGFIFPYLIKARRIALLLKGVPRKLR